MTIVIFLYVLANMAYLNVVPLDILKQTDTIALVLPLFSFLPCTSVLMDSADSSRILAETCSVTLGEYISAGSCLFPV